MTLARSAVALVIWAGLLAPAAAQPPYNSSAAHLAAIQKAREALAAGRTTAALALLDDVLKATPYHRDAAALKIVALAETDDRAGALKAYEAWNQAARREDVTLLEPLAKAELHALRSTPLPVVQGGALEALAAAGDADARRALDTAFRSATPTTLTWDATVALARLGDGSAARKVQETATQGAGGARIRAIQVLKDLPNPAGLSAILRSALATGDVMLQVAVADTAGTMRVKELVPDFKRVLTTAEPFARLWIASALKRLGDDSGTALLASALGGDVVDTRLVAARALADSDDRSWIARVRPLLDSSEALNRLYAAELLVAVERSKALDVLKKGLEDPNHVVRGEAARILTAVNAQDIWTLRWMLRDGAPLVRFLAARTLLAESATAAGARPGVRPAEPAAGLGRPKGVY